MNESQRVGGRQRRLDMAKAMSPSSSSSSSYSSSSPSSSSFSCFKPFRIFWMFVPRSTLTLIFILAGLVRLVMIAFGEWQDAHLVVKYTDIDYIVFSDASAFVARGQSPYLRYTYRYTPLLAYMLLPNIFLHKCIGKLLFSCFDLLAGWILHSILSLRGVPSHRTAYLIAAWLFNPFTFTVATRGNCDAMVSVMMLWVLLCLMQGKLITAAIWYGLAVHVRIYPIVYALPFILVLDKDYPSVAARLKRRLAIVDQQEKIDHDQEEEDASLSNHFAEDHDKIRKPVDDIITTSVPAAAAAAAEAVEAENKDKGKDKVRMHVDGILTQVHGIFTAAAAAGEDKDKVSKQVSGILPTAAEVDMRKSGADRSLSCGGGGNSRKRKKTRSSDSCASMFLRFVNRERLQFALVSGGTFLLLTFVFFSIYGMDFLFDALLYHLTRSDPRHNFSIQFYQSYLRFNLAPTLANRLLAFVPQLLVLLVLGAVFAKDLPFCIFLQTLTFVAFNKVCTAQYFVWYFCLLPLILPSTRLRLRWQGVLLAAIWCCAQIHWLGWAFLLEFKGRNAFVPLWIASIFFFAANVWVMLQLIRHHRFCPLFRGGTIRQLNREEQKEVHSKVL